MKIQIEFKEYRKTGVKEIITRIAIVGLVLMVLVLLLKDQLYY